MVYGDLDTHDATCRLLAERAGVRVLALDYRLAPEHRYPAGLDDCWAGYQWAVEHAEELGVDPERVAVGGDSAGGYFGAVVAIRAANAGVPCAFQLLVYPVDQPRRRQPQPGDVLPGLLPRPGVHGPRRWTPISAPDVDRADADVSVQYTEKLPDGLAPALVVTAGFDPLRDEGETYARTLAEAGVQVELQRYPGFIHGFFNIVGVGRSNRAAVAEIAAKLKAALNPADRRWLRCRPPPLVEVRAERASKPRRPRQGGFEVLAQGLGHLNQRRRHLNQREPAQRGRTSRACPRRRA